jgi:hypothetical protein
MYWERLFRQLIKFVHGDEPFCGPWRDCLCRWNDEFFIVLLLREHTDRHVGQELTYVSNVLSGPHRESKLFTGMGQYISLRGRRSVHVWQNLWGRCLLG